MNAQTATQRMTDSDAGKLFWTDYTMYVGESGGNDYAMNWTDWLYETQGVVLA